MTDFEILTLVFEVLFGVLSLMIATVVAVAAFRKK